MKKFMVFALVITAVVLSLVSCKKTGPAQPAGRTSTQTPSPSITPWQSATVTASYTQTPWQSATVTATYTGTATITVTPTITETATVTATPTLTSTPPCLPSGVFYGLQVILPGTVVNEGYGVLMPPFSMWDNAVAGLPSSVMSGAYFPVTIRACDICGYPVDTVTDQVSLYASGSFLIDAASFPVASNQSVVNLVNGVAVVTAQLEVSQASDAVFYCSDLTDPAKNRILMSQPLLPVLDTGYMETLVTINGVKYGDGTNNITLNANTDFSMTIERVNSVSQLPVYGSSDSFTLSAVLASDPFITAPGNLAITAGSVNNGVFTSGVQRFDTPSDIRIKASVAGSSDRYSCVIHIQ